MEMEMGRRKNGDGNWLGGWVMVTSWESSSAVDFFLRTVAFTRWGLGWAGLCEGDGEG